MTKIGTNPSRMVLYSGLFFFAFLYKWFWLPGEDFNSMLWDDENRWVKEASGRSFWEQMTLRDAPGYFLPAMRFLIWVSTQAGSHQIFVVRALVYLIQILSILIAVRVFFPSLIKRSFLFFLSTSLVFFYIEDFNYLHNVGYLLFFPCRFLLLKMESASRVGYIVCLILFSLLLSKPIVAVLLLASLVVAYLKSVHLRPKLNAFFIVVAFYLLTYLLLPNSWSTPFNSNIGSILPILINVFWVFPAVFLPSVFIGTFGLLHLLKLEVMANILGVSSFIFFLVLAIKFFPLIAAVIRRVLRTDFELFSLTILSYLLGYSASNVIWISYFPLWTNPQAQWVWTRWNGLFPIMLTLLMGKVILHFRSNWALYFFPIVLSQSLVLQAIGFSFLRRFW